MVHGEEGLVIYLQPLEVQDEVEKSLQKMYEEQGILPLTHSYQEYEVKDLTFKRRRIQQL